MITTIKTTRTITEEQTIVVCDNCSKSLQDNILEGRRSHKLPTGSYILRVAIDDPGAVSEEDKEFCSKACLIAWCTKEKNIGTNGPANGQDSGKYISR